MKKETQYSYQYNKNFETNKDFDKDKIKTTNVNILLNRVRLDKKRTLRNDSVDKLNETVIKLNEALRGHIVTSESLQLSAVYAEQMNEYISTLRNQDNNEFNYFLTLYWYGTRRLRHAIACTYRALAAYEESDRQPMGKETIQMLWQNTIAQFKVYHEGKYTKSPATPTGMNMDVWQEKVNAFRQAAFEAGEGFNLTAQAIEKAGSSTPRPGDGAGDGAAGGGEEVAGSAAPARSSSPLSPQT